MIAAHRCAFHELIFWLGAFLLCLTSLMLLPISLLYHLAFSVLLLVLFPFVFYWHYLSKNALVHLAHIGGRLWRVRLRSGQWCKVSLHKSSSRTGFWLILVFQSDDFLLKRSIILARSDVPDRLWSYLHQAMMTE
jgi:hypothetical protein